MSPDLDRLIELQQLDSTIEEARRRIAAHPDRPKFWGHGLVQLASGPSYIDLSLWHRPASKEKGANYNDFYSGNAAPHDPKAAATARAAKAAPEPR
jgi:hypothetical protein